MVFTTFKSATAITAILAILAMPSLAYAKTVTATIEMKKFNGPRAYLALYLTKPNGAFHSTLAIHGNKSKYRRHLRGWFKGVSRQGGKIDGVSGASVGSGRILSVKADIADALIKAGYQVRVDTSVEDVGDFANDAVAGLNAGKPKTAASGKALVKSITVTH